ncbi:hypothetical protein C8R46DRAFT_1088170 [Mycena filopes]|nr:hypothetical protein C8R46DRAFT_1088170 [Mycena filopes]
MSDDSTQIGFPGPRLPPDLERLIFEDAARSHPRGIPTFVLVAWRIKSWLEPFLYRVLCIADTKTRKKDGFRVLSAETVLRAFESRPHTLFMAGVPECLFFHSTPPEYAPSATLNALLSACPHITTLSSSIGLGASLNALQSLQNLRRLSINARDLFYPAAVDFAHPLFRKITHLELFENPDEHEVQVALPSYATMVTIPNLSHVAFNGVWLCGVMRPLFQAHGGAAARLRCFVFLSTGEPLHGPRFPLFVHVAQTDFVGHWLRGVHKGEDYWSLAEEFIAAKRARRVPHNLYKILDRPPFWEGRRSMDYATRFLATTT